MNLNVIILNINRLINRWKLAIVGAKVRPICWLTLRGVKLTSWPFIWQSGRSGRRRRRRHGAKNFRKVRITDAIATREKDSFTRYVAICKWYSIPLPTPSTPSWVRQSRETWKCREKIVRVLSYFSVGLSLALSYGTRETAHFRVFAIFWVIFGYFLGIWVNFSTILLIF